MKERHFLAGNITANGFHSYFDHILTPSQANHFYILKGGSGVGKSFFMKKFASMMLKKDHNVEFIHCSSDKDSLDAIVITDLKIAFVDGTMPHVVEQKVAGAVDEIINLGTYLNNEKMKKYKFEIIEINKKKSLLYNSAYRYLECANLIQEEINSIYESLSDQSKFIELFNNTINKIFSDIPLSNTYGNVRKLFSESYSSCGYVSYTDTLCDKDIVYNVVGENSNNISLFLEKLSEEVVKRGLDIECFYSPINPLKVQHLYIPKLNILFRSTHDSINNYSDYIIDLNSIVNKEELKLYISQIENNLHLFNMLIKNALSKLSETKKYHELLESLYKDNMDFECVDKCFNEIFSKYI